uniref:Uncharacterized protein n=1 Tax=Pseudomonas syringae pv. actinidiae TaxID=103796 RepID=A0A2P0QHS7_PSESF|nr:hypothetical protein [Pseudomonas syringae pv. actinidiae]
MQTACSADALAGLSCVRTQCQAWEITLRLPTARSWPLTGLARWVILRAQLRPAKSVFDDQEVPPWIRT